MMLALGLLCGLGTMTAQVRTHSLGVELGSHNVLLYELTLARHFSVVSRTGPSLTLSHAGTSLEIHQVAYITQVAI